MYGASFLLIINLQANDHTTRVTYLRFLLVVLNSTSWLSTNIAFQSHESSKHFLCDQEANTDGVTSSFVSSPLWIYFATSLNIGLLSQKRHLSNLWIFYRIFLDYNDRLECKVAWPVFTSKRSLGTCHLVTTAEEAVKYFKINSDPFKIVAKLFRLSILSNGLRNFTKRIHISIWRCQVLNCLK